MGLGAEPGTSRARLGFMWAAIQQPRMIRLGQSQIVGEAMAPELHVVAHWRSFGFSGFSVLGLANGRVLCEVQLELAELL